MTDTVIVAQPDTLVEEWFAACSGPGAVGLGLRLFANGSVCLDLVDATATTTTATFPPDAFALVAALVPALFAAPGVAVHLPHHTPAYDTVTLALDEHRPLLVFTIGSSTQHGPMMQGLMARGHAILIIDNILAAARALHPAVDDAGSVLEGV